MLGLGACTGPDAKDPPGPDGEDSAASVDGADPWVTLDAPLDGAMITGPVPWSATAGDDVGVVNVGFDVDGERRSTNVASPYQTTLASTLFTDGAHTLRVVATDAAGRTASDEIEITIDNTAPEVVITAPTDGDLVQGTISASALASDGVGLEGVTFTLDGDELGEFSAEPYATDLDTTALAFGEHTLTAVAVDGADHESTDEITFSVDNPPTVAFTAPTETTVSGSVVIRVEASDDDRIVGLSVSYAGEVLSSTTTAESLGLRVNTCEFDHDEVFELEVLAADSGGNIVTALLNLTADQPLEASVDDVSGTADLTLSVGASVADDQEIVEVVWDVDGEVVATATDASGSDEVCFDCGCGLYISSFSTAGLSEGDHTLTVTATNVDGETASDATTFLVGYDHDGDGYDSDGYGGDDCDDEDPDVSPAGLELCDGVDQDCDGEVDEDFDVDDDGYADAELCPDLGDDTDCDDADPDVSPGVTESCDGVDQNCDGVVDNAEALSAATTRFGNTTDDLSITLGGNAYTAATSATITGFSAYFRSKGGATTVTWAIYASAPGASEYSLVDSNSSVVAGFEGWYSSGTFDVTMTTGHQYLLVVGSADELTAFREESASAEEGGGLTALGATRVSDVAATTISSRLSTSKLYAQKVDTLVPSELDADLDEDGTTVYCGDCDDEDDAVAPGATEVCDGLDNDCDGESDEAPDTDGDGERACTDCDDGDAEVYTGATEVCDGLDNDCDGAVDQSPSDGTVYYRDGDVDGYGDDAEAASFCVGTSGWAPLGGDCDDLDAGVSPGVAEACDGVDNDCDGEVDEDFDGDLDGDGYTSCTGDCDEGDADIAPGQTELCEDGVDQNCDGLDAWCETSGAYDMGSTGDKLWGEAAEDLAGHSVDAHGDQDGDGLADLLIGAPDNDEGGDDAGAVYIIPGGTVTGGALGDGDLIKLIGESGYDHMGYAVSDVGDQNGDGYDDLIVGGPGVDDGGPDRGAGLLVLGPTVTDLDLSEADARLVGEDADTCAGAGVGDAGDVNGDGEPDLWIGGPRAVDWGETPGVVYLVLGPISADVDLAEADGRLYGDWQDFVGYRAAAGDTDGDGYDDMLVGDLFYDIDNIGAAYLVLGPDPTSGKLNTSADARMLGTSAHTYAGSAVALADVDGDGYDDAIVGAQGRSTSGHSEDGALYVVYGPATTSLELSVSADLVISGAEDDASFGISVSARDLDQDGVHDLLIGAHNGSDGGASAGAAYLFYGPVASGEAADLADARFVGEDEGDHFGFSLSIGGDVNGDGPLDLLIGAYNEDHTTGTAAGSAYVIYP